MKSTVYLFIFFELWAPGCLELFTSTEHLQVLVDTQEKTIKSLEKYIKKETQRTNIIEKHLARFQNEHKLAMKDVSYYLGNPMNALMLIKRLSHDLDFIEHKIKGATAFRQVVNATFPTKKDLEGAIKALLRLQVTYQLNVTQLANGELRANFTSNNLYLGVQYKLKNKDAIEHQLYQVNSIQPFLEGRADGKVHNELFTPLTASDCYEIGRGYINETENSLGIPWLLMAHQKHQLEANDAHEIDEVEIAKSIFTAYFKMDDLQNMIIWLNAVIDSAPKDPSAPRWRDLVLQYEERLEKEQQARREGWHEAVTVLGKQHISGQIAHGSTIAQTDLKIFQIYCGSEEQLPVRLEIRKRLKCRYQTGPHPFLRLAPFKSEQLFEEPIVLLLRDVITDDEIEELKNIAKPRMKRIKRNINHHYHLSDAIISKSSLVSINESDAVRKIQKRVAMITGLAEEEEPIEVANYGISGHRLPHYDFLKHDDEYLSPQNADRIATMFFFMSNITQGGAIVFPRLGVKVYPEKGTALFWYNLHPSGEGNIATQHADCPVLLGNKWVAVLFKSTIGQELHRPCSDEHQEMCDLRPYHYIVPEMAHETVCTDEYRYYPRYDLMRLAMNSF